MDEAVTVLLVDDAEMVRGRLRALVDDVDGVRVVGEAGGVAEARAVLEAVRPDVVVLDLRLGDGSGLELLREMGPCRLAPRVIVLTNEAWPLYRRECLAAGADWFFDKTTEFHRVPEVLAAEAGSRRHAVRVAAGRGIAPGAPATAAGAVRGPGGLGVE